MRYYAVRYLHGLKKILKWFPVIFLPVLVYLLMAAARPDRFLVSQNISAQGTIPISLSNTPVDCMTLSKLLKQPRELFLDDFSLSELFKQIPKGDSFFGEISGIEELKNLIEAGMKLKMTGSDQVLIEYMGPDLVLGKLCVAYFSQRLITRSKDGIMRTQRKNKISGISEEPPSRAGFTPSNPSVSLTGELKVQEQRSLWRTNRLTPSIEVLLISLLCWCVTGGIVEWLEPSFFSERQVSRYLNIPVIGVIPDLGTLVERVLI